LKGETDRLARPTAYLQSALRTGQVSIFRTDKHREALEAILGHERVRLLANPENAGQLKQIENQYNWGSKDSMGKLQDIAQRLGIIPIGAKYKLFTGFNKFNNREAVQAGANVFQAIFNAPNAHHEFTIEQRKFYEEYIALTGNGSDPEAVLTQMAARAAGYDGVNPFHKIFASPGTIETTESINKATEAFNLALEKGLAGANPVAPRGDQLWGPRDPRLIWAAIRGSDPLLLSPALVKKATDIFRTLAPDYDGDSGSLMNDVVRQLVTGPEGFSLSATTVMPTGQMQKGANLVQYALETFVPPDQVHLVNDLVRTAVLTSSTNTGRSVTEEQVAALALGEGTIWLSPSNTSGDIPTYNIWYKNSDGYLAVLDDKDGNGNTIRYELDISPAVNAIQSESSQDYLKDFFVNVYGFTAADAVAPVLDANIAISRGADHVIESAKAYIGMSRPDVPEDKISDRAEEWQAKINISSIDATKMQQIPITAAGITGDSFRKMINLIPEPARLVWEAFDVNVIRGEVVGSGKKTVFTEKNFHPPVLEVIRQAGRNALKGRELEPGTSIAVSYPHYPKTARGLTAETIVGNGMSASYRKIREAIYAKNALGWTRLAYDATTDPVMRTAYSVGGFMLHRAKDGSYFIDDKFNFNGYHNKSKSDGYAWLRHIFSKAEGAPQRTSEGPRVYLKLGDKL